AKARAFYGGLLGYPEIAPLRFKINDRQYVAIVPGLPPAQDDRLSHVAFETTDLAGLRGYLDEKGIKTNDPADEGGDRVLRVSDPDGHAVEFVQHVRGA